MKKVILALAVASVFVACNNSGSDKPAADSTKTTVKDSVKTTVIDSVKTTVTDTTKKAPVVDTAKKAK